MMPSYCHWELPPPASGRKSALRASCQLRYGPGFPSVLPSPLLIRPIRSFPSALICLLTEFPLLCYFLTHDVYVNLVGLIGRYSRRDSIWRSFIPFESFQVFQRGGYYSVEVIRNELAVISLNTMYFYDSNKG